MATNFPASLDSLSNPSPSNTLDSPSHSTHHANLNDAIEALEAKVGVDGSAVATSHDKILTLKANLASPTFTGTVTAPTFSGALSGTATSATTAGTVTTAAQPAITSATTGTFTAGTFSGSGAGLTNIPGDKLFGGQTISNTQQYTFGATETYWVNTYSAGNVQVNLPNAASYPGRILHIRNSVGAVHIYSGTNNVAYVTSAATANTDWYGASYVLHQGDGFWCQLLSNGSIWVTTMTSEI